VQVIKFDGLPVLVAMVARYYVWFCIKRATLQSVYMDTSGVPVPDGACLTYDSTPSALCLAVTGRSPVPASGHTNTGVIRCMGIY
jgi:hypothetical protein